MKPLGFRRIENAVISGGNRTAGVFDDGVFVKGTSLFRSVGFSVCPALDQVTDRDEDVLFIGTFHACWGHCICDELKHLWFVLQGLPEEYRKLRFAYASLIPKEKLPNNFIRLLSLLGIDLGDAVRVESPVRFRSCVVPDPCVEWDGVGSAVRPRDEYSLLIERLIGAVVGTVRNEPHRRVYLSRTHFSGKDYGEESIEKAFAEAGYEIVYPEELTFDSLVRLLSEVGDFAATLGSVSHNVVFLPVGAHATIVRKTDAVNNHQIALERVRGLRVDTIDSGFSPPWLRYEADLPTQGPFYLYVSRALARHLGVKPRWSPWAFVRYFCWAFTLHWGHRAGEAWRRLTA